MPRLTANPNAEVNSGFDVVKPCVTRLRVKSVEEVASKSSSNTLWKFTWEFVDPTSLDKLDGSGQAKNPGTLIDNSLVINPAEKQGKLRGLVEALGRTWEDLDSDSLVGLELDAKIGTEEYNGEPKNKIVRYLKQK